LHLSRNFGHQTAITAGIEWAHGDTVTVMDADLQDPPEVILELIAKWREGFEVVYAVRRMREGETVFKLWTAKIFYRMIRKLTRVDIPVDTGDFRLMDRKAIDAFLKMPERHRFVRGMVSWVGFRQGGVLYDRASRVHGQTHYPFRKMFKFALDGVTSFSIFPLQIASYIGMLAAAVAFVGILYTLYFKFFTDRTVQGWSSIMIVVLFLGGAQLLALGIIGEYLGRTYDESRRRPLYFVGRAVGFEEPGCDRRSVD
jgi:dolichol-phosphate mannosyltransferase